MSMARKRITKQVLSAVLQSYKSLGFILFVDVMVNVTDELARLFNYLTGESVFRMTFGRSYDTYFISE